MPRNLFNDCCSMLDAGWTQNSPQSGTYTVMNITEYSNGHSELVATTVKDSVRKKKKNIEDIEIYHEKLLNAVGLEGGEGDDLFLSLTEPTLIKELTEFDKEENKQRSLRRTRTVIRKKIIEGELDHFLTLTYRDNKTDIKECWKDWKKFIRLVQKKYPSLRYLVIIERQKRGAVHFHAAIHGYLHANSIRALWLKVVGQGNIDIKCKQRNQSLHGLANYITKYLTKQYEEIDNFTNLYRCSRNIKLFQLKFYLSKEFAMIRSTEIEKAIKVFLNEVNQEREFLSGLYSCKWVSSLPP